MSDKYKESEVYNRPGWTRIQYGGARRYRSPGGVEISNTQYTKLSATYPPPHEIPESAIATESGIRSASNALSGLRSSANKPKEFISNVSPSKPAPTPIGIPTISPQEQVLQQQQTVSPHVDIGKQAQPSGRPPVIPPPEMPEDQVADIQFPEAKSNVSHGRPSANKATATEISRGLKTSLIITTGVVAIATSTPDAGMTELEANNISIPAGNLIAKSRLNERIGKLIAESGDWQMLGYALYLFGSRINSDIQARGGWSQKLGFGRNQRPQQPVYHPTEPVQQSNGHQPTSGVFMPPSNRSNRPPGVNYGGQE